MKQQSVWDAISVGTLVSHLMSLKTEGQIDSGVFKLRFSIDTGVFKAQFSCRAFY